MSHHEKQPKHESGLRTDDAMSRKVLELSRKKDLDPTEARFVSALADLGSRTVSYVLEQRGATLPVGDSFGDSVKEYTKSAVRVFEHEGHIDEDMRANFNGAPTDLGKLISVLTRYTNLGPSATDKIMRPRVEDCALAVDTMLSEVMAQNPALQVDSYMASNLDTIASHYEQITA